MNERILLLQRMDPAGMDLLEQAGCRVEVPDSCEETRLAAIAGDFDAIIVRGMAKLPAAVIRAASACRVIGRHGVGLETIDLAEATRRRIPVLNTPGANANAVAEQTVGLMLDVAKQTCLLHHKLTRERDYACRLGVQNRELSGKTLGLVGLGQIGRRVARICQRGFGMEVLGYDPLVSQALLEAADAGIRRLPTLEEVIRRADVLSLHAPPGEQPLIGRRELGWMKAGGILINTARGELIDEEALLEALRSGHLLGAGLDVLAQEPPPREHPFYHLDNLVLLPHTAALTVEGNQAMARSVAVQVLQVLRGERPAGLVNPNIWDSRRGAPQAANHTT